jgi:hypothetical protein
LVFRLHRVPHRQILRSLFLASRASFLCCSSAPPAQIAVVSFTAPKRFVAKVRRRACRAEAASSRMSGDGPATPTQPHRVGGSPLTNHAFPSFSAKLSSRHSGA